jgi:hypothetical protein
LGGISTRYSLVKTSPWKAIRGLFIQIKGSMKLQWLAFFLIVMLSLSCSDSSRQAGKARNEMDNEKRPGNKPAGSYSDTVTVNIPSAVFYYPDSLQLEKIRAVSDTMIYESTMHDCFYQMRNARNSLKKNWLAIKIVEVSKARWILFRLLNGTSEYIDLDTLNDPCGILLFDGHKKARLVDMMNIDSELGFYFTQ